MNVSPGHATGRDAVPAGILVLNKPTGVTSRALVNQIARLRPRSKVGHAGTLDPLASGILIICIGPATRLVENIQDLAKSYRTSIRLGARSDTLDADGCIEALVRPRVPSLSEVEEAIAPLVGSVLQTPPAYSALKLKGRRAYDLARAGETVKLAPRTVRIDRIALLQYHWPHLELEIDCGGGTYIRSIARDIGEALECGGYVETLVRTRTGPFVLEQAVGPRSVSAESIDRLLRPALEAVPSMPRLMLDATQVEAIALGKRLPTREVKIEVPLPAGQVALLNGAGTLIALGDLDPDQGWLQPRKVLV